MRRWVALAFAAPAFAAPALEAAELPSFLRDGDAFCTDEAAFDDFAAHGHPRAGLAIPACETIDRPTRVAVMQGRGGVKSQVLVMDGPHAYTVGWTNATLPTR